MYTDKRVMMPGQEAKATTRIRLQRLAEPGKRKITSEVKRQQFYMIIEHKNKKRKQEVKKCFVSFDYQAYYQTKV